MHTKSTLFLLVLTAAAGLWLWKGDEWGQRIGLPSPSQAAAPSPSMATLKDHFTADKITRIEILGDSSSALTIEKTSGDTGWKLPGNWPLRKQEVDELVALFTNLRTRFQAIPISGDTDLSPYGLAAAQKPLVVKIAADNNTTYTLSFGEAKIEENDSPFVRAAYLRINDNPELLRLGPDIMPVLRRSPDSYRRRQLFPESERVKIASAAPPSPFGPPGAGASTVAILTDKVKEIDVRSTLPKPDSYVLKRVAPFPQPVAEEKGGEPVVAAQRIADAWEIASPERERLDADKLQKILTTIPDLWVEEFATDAGKANLDKPERTLIVTLADGSKLTLLIGAVSKTVEREETVAGPPPMPGFPPTPMTRKILDEYRFAKLADNPQVFVLRADRLADLFVSADSLRDPQLVHFKPDDVQNLTIALPGKPEVKLIRKDDKWLMERKPEPVAAEASVVSELLSQLSGLRSSGGDSKGKAEGGATVTVVAKDKTSPDRTVVLHLGRPKIGPWPAIASATSALVAVAVGANQENETIPARLEGWPHVASVEAAILKTLAPEGGFRDRTITNFSGADKFVLERGGKTFTFAKTGALWKQTTPKEAAVESGGELEDFSFLVGRLRVERFIAEHATPEELKKFGLDPPQAKWSFFAGGKELAALLIGGKDAAGHVYAKLANSDAVALLPEEASKKVFADFRSRKVWTLDEAKVDSIEIVDRDGKKFQFARKDAGWEDPAAPKDAIDPKAVSESLAALGALKAERWADLPEDTKKAGFEKPSETITLTQRDGMKHVLLLGGFTDDPMSKRFYAKTNEAGAEPFVLGVQDASRLTRDRKAYMLTEPKKKDEKKEEKKEEKKKDDEKKKDEKKGK